MTSELLMATASPPFSVNSTPNGGLTSSSREEDEDDLLTDHYGFQYSPQQADMHYMKDVSPKECRKKETKWLKILDNWDYWIQKKPEKIKKYCRAGVPSSLRSRAWMKLSGAQLLKEQHPKNFYNDLLRKDDNRWCSDIDKDLDRTFPEHEQFCSDEMHQIKGSMPELRNVLKAYSIHNEALGYCQAMAPVTATLLMQMTPEDSFWCLVAICQYYVPGYYNMGLHQVKVDAAILDGLIIHMLPHIHKHFTSCDDTSQTVDALLYCTEWFMSFFTRALPWSCVLRIWDMFLFEGVKVLFRTALAILQLVFGNSNQRIGCTGFYDITKKLRNLPINITHEDVLIPQLLSFKLTSADLTKEHRRQEKADKEADVRYNRTLSINKRTSQKKK
ncbi:TBC1 domain family member 10A-like [Dysidea avara]|uniref:TBC1 domain family member 10A-like n=1 Tax=Dysidea avara TaxID=196820 RepID=UPI00331F4C18